VVSNVKDPGLAVAVSVAQQQTTATALPQQQTAATLQQVLSAAAVAAGQVPHLSVAPQQQQPPPGITAQHVIGATPPPGAAAAAAAPPPILQAHFVAPSQQSGVIYMVPNQPGQGQSNGAAALAPPAPNFATISQTQLPQQPVLPMPGLSPTPPRAASKSSQHQQPPPARKAAPGIHAGQQTGFGKLFYFMDQMRAEVVEADRAIKSLQTNNKFLVSFDRSSIISFGIIALPYTDCCCFTEREKQRA